MLLIPGDDDMVQHIRPIRKSVTQEIVDLRRKEDRFKYARKKSCVI